jgi:hypothetical protein
MPLSSYAAGARYSDEQYNIQNFPALQGKCPHFLLCQRVKQGVSFVNSTNFPNFVPSFPE